MSSQFGKSTTMGSTMSAAMQRPATIVTQRSPAERPLEKDYEVVLAPTRALSGPVCSSNPTGSGQMDVKTGVMEAVSHAVNLDMIKSLKVMRKGRKGKSGLSPTRTMLYFMGSASSAAGAALASVVQIDVGGIPEVSGGWVNLYDEVKVHAVKVFYRYTDTTGTSTNAPRWSVVCYDPLDSTALTTVLGGLEHSQKQLTGLASNQSQTAGAVSTPAPVNSRGHFEFDAHVAQVGAFDTSLPSIPGQWHSLATGPIDGQVKWYVENNATGVITLDYIIGVDVTFRSRT